MSKTTQRFWATQIADEDKPAILRAYLRRWKTETRAFSGVDANSNEDDLRRIATDPPVFRIDSSH